MNDILDDVRHLLALPPEQRGFREGPSLVPTLAVVDLMARAVRRCALSRDAVLTADEIIDVIGGRAALVRAWVRDTLIPLRHPTGRTVYRWGDVLDAMRRAA